MKRFLKFVGIVLGALVLLVIIGVAGLYALSSSAANETVAPTSHGFAAPTDSASVARGEHVVRALVKCADCHGENLAGGFLSDDAAFGRLVAPNLTRGRGGIGGEYTDADFERAIRHGRARDGRRLIIMPANDYQYVSDEDLGAIVAYLRSVPAVDTVMPKTRLGPIARVLIVTKAPLFPADVITHTDGVIPSVPVDSTAEYGNYIGNVGCAGCHGTTYGGGKIPGAPPELPAPANLTPTGIGHYSYADFQGILRTGVRPDGSKLHPMMPIQATKLMTDVEMRAIYLYLQTLAPRPFGSR